MLIYQLCVCENFHWIKILPSPGTFVLQKNFAEKFCGNGHHILYIIFNAGQKSLCDKLESGWEKFLCILWYFLSLVQQYIIYMHAHQDTYISKELCSLSYAEIPVVTATTTVLTSNDVTIWKDDIITNANNDSKILASTITLMSLTDSTAFMATDSVHMDSKVTNRVTVSLLIFVGVLLLLLLPGAIYGFVKVSKTIITYEIKTFRGSAASVDEKYIIIHKKT